ncbi:protein-L-isoaspartate(D-aspartate) O-methyltransferase [Homoserinimonas sp. A447]
MDEFEASRNVMVETQLAARGIRDRRVLEAMRTVPRHLFVPPDQTDYAYDDRPLPIGSGQTISQPYIVAFMAEQARIGPDARVLEIGTGSGYAAAVLGALAAQVYTIERHPELADAARTRLADSGATNVDIVVGDGTRGLPAEAPFDAILATASGPDVPRPLIEQLTVGGRLVIPVERRFGHQQLMVVERTEDGYEEDAVLGVAFVPLIGEYGHPE